MNEMAIIAIISPIISIQALAIILLNLRVNKLEENVNKLFRK